MEDNRKHPCDLCDKDCLYLDCVHYSMLGDEYCNNYDCRFEYEGSCMLGMASRCAVSNNYEMDGDDYE